MMYSSLIDKAYTIEAFPWKGGLFRCTWFHKSERTKNGFLCTAKTLEYHFWRLG